MLISGGPSARYGSVDGAGCAISKTGSHGLNRITETSLAAHYKVGGALGNGILEKVNENALAHELRKAGLQVEQQHPISVWYMGKQR
jgi:hypothetical protein